jgi:predicted Zn-dependent peptidase
LNKNTTGKKMKVPTNDQLNNIANLIQNHPTEIKNTKANIQSVDGFISFFSQHVELVNQYQTIRAQLLNNIAYYEQNTNIQALTTEDIAQITQFYLGEKKLKNLLTQIKSVM